MDNKLQEIKAEVDDFYSDDDLFKISSWGADLSFRELIERYEEGDLIKPELQRKYVWDKTEASRFIDSLLLGLPVPSIFLAKTDSEKQLIIDGYQRIMTVYDFVKGIFSGDGKVFRLVRSEKINSRWRGKAFSELNEVEQRKIRNTTIHAIIFIQLHPNSDNTSLFQVFERINTSGRTLFPQEIRNCVYQGHFNDLLFELNKLQDWRSLFGSSIEDQRMRDVELILRFLALSSDEFNNLDKEQISLKKFLNQFMSKYKDMTDIEMDGFRNRFINVTTFINENIASNAFNNLSTKNPEKFSPIFSPTIFDSMMVATDYLLTNHVDMRIEHINEKRKALLLDSNYRSYITHETMRVQTIKNRIEKVKQILYNIGI